VAAEERKSPPNRGGGEKKGGTRKKRKTAKIANHAQKEHVIVDQVTLRSQKRKGVALVTCGGRANHGRRRERNCQ